MKTTACSIVLALAVFNMTSAAQAEADPKLQALVDSRIGQLSDDSKRLKELNALDREQEVLGRGGAVEIALEAGQREPGENALEAAGNLQDAVNNFQNAAAELASDLNAAAANVDNLTSQGVDDLGERVKELNDHSFALGAAVAAARDENVSSFDSALHGPIFFETQVVVIQTNLVVQLANPYDDKPVVDHPILGRLDENLKALAIRIQDQAKIADKFGDGVNPQEIARRNQEIARRNQEIARRNQEIARRDELANQQEARRQEQAKIERRADITGNGGDVLAALGERLGDDSVGKNGRFADDEAAGQRVQDLAEGLAGAGQRIAEINQELKDVNTENAVLRQEHDQLLARQEQLGLLAQSEKFSREDSESKEKIRGFIDIADADIARRNRELQEAREQGRDQGEIDKLLVLLKDAERTRENIGRVERELNDAEQKTIEQNQKRIGANLKFIDNAIVEARKKLEEAREAGREQDAIDFLRRIEFLEEERKKVRGAVEEVARDGFDPDAAREELDRNRKEADEKFKEIEEADDKRDRLLAERDAIAGLQGELANLIRDGAPLGKPDAVAAGNDANRNGNNGDSSNKKDDDKKKIAIDAFLQGNDNDAVTTPGGEQAALDTNLPDVVKNAIDADPLASDQLGFEADIGSTENTLAGVGGGVPAGYFVCPAGSTGLPPGSITNSLASCY